MNSKYLKFVEAPAKPKTRCFWVVNKLDNHHVGNIGWFSRWRKYAFFPLPGMVFEEDCLRDIAGFVADLTSQHRKSRKELAHAHD